MFIFTKNKLVNCIMKTHDNNTKKIPSYLICHRIPDRTFKIRNNYFPVCSRCTGAYIGMFSYYVFAYFVYVEYTLPIVLMSSLMIMPMLFDGITQLFELRESNNSLRFFTGLIGGIGLGILFKTFKWVLIS